MFYSILLRFILFIFNITIVMLNSQIVPFLCMECEWPKKEIFILRIYYE